MKDVAAFQPKPGATVSLAVIASSNNAAIDSGGVAKARKWRVYNAGSAVAFVSFGGSDVTASTATGTPIPPGAVEVFQPSGATHIAGITASGSTSLYITPGEGI